MSIPFSLPSGARGRTPLLLALVPAVVLVLFLVGRHSSTAAAPASSVEAAPSESAASMPPVADGSDRSDASADAADGLARDAPSEDAPIDGAAVTALADGGVVVDINRASEDELRKLPGIGVGRARAIVALRARLGRFRTVDDLARVRGLGRGGLRRLRPFVRVS
jgi:competence protein ComEA